MSTKPYGHAKLDWAHWVAIREAEEIERQNETLRRWAAHLDTCMDAKCVTCATFSAMVHR